MGQVVHGCTKTTRVLRLAMKSREESLKALTRKCEINPKTNAKWKKRATVQDTPH